MSTPFNRPLRYSVPTTMAACRGTASTICTLYRLNRAQRKYLLRSFHSMCKTVATADGIVTVGTHHMAHGCIEAAIADGRAPSSIRDDYAQAGADVLDEFNPSASPENAGSVVRVGARRP